MSGIVTVRKSLSARYTVLPNHVIKDPRLTWASLGLLAFIFQLPNDFKLRLSFLAQQKTNGRDATRTAIKCLESAGYLMINLQRGARGRFAPTTWYVTDTPGLFPQADDRPRTGFPNPVTPNPAIPDTDEPRSEIPTLTNTKLKKVLGIKTTTTTPSNAEVNTQNWHFPPGLTDTDRQSILTSISSKLRDASIADIQCLLDELTAAYEAGKIKRTPAVYFLGLVTSYAKGSFAPVCGPDIARRRMREKCQMVSTVSDLKSVTRTDPEAAREKLAGLRAALSSAG